VTGRYLGLCASLPVLTILGLYAADWS
jgi:hypothetical protein